MNEAKWNGRKRITNFNVAGDFRKNCGKGQKRLNGFVFDDNSCRHFAKKILRFSVVRGH